MAVYTKITDEEIRQHLEGYQLGDLLAFTEILEGIDNSNFILETTSGKFILTIFESRIDKNSLPFFINFKLHLAKKSIPCPRPIADNSGNNIVEFKGKKSVIVTFVQGEHLKSRSDGYYDNITAKHCYEVGKTLAQLHEAASDFTMARSNELGINGWNSMFNRFKDLAEVYQEHLSDEIATNLNFLGNSWRFDLPSGANHLDLFPDNVFFDDDGKVSGIIDFYFAASDALVYDFAIIVNAWCFDRKNHFDEKKFSEMLRGYEEVRKFSEDEQSFLKIALVGAAMRFLLTRLNDMLFTPKTALVKIKDPEEYLDKLRFFKRKVWA